MSAKPDEASAPRAADTPLDLPIRPPFEPMEAKPVAALPTSKGPWLFEPKWDGFRCLVFRDRHQVELQSKAGQPLSRYFPELVEALRALPIPRFVVDGEIMIPHRGGFDFDLLLQRVHPAASRVKKLSVETPAHLHLFDLLVDGRGHSLVEAPLETRRAALEAFVEDAGLHPGAGSLILSPATTDREVVGGWERDLRGHGIDGIVAKRLDLPYAPGERTAMQKMKWIRTADCVVGGFRYAAKGGFGSLLLGLYDGDGKLDHVGFCSAFPNADKPALLAKVEALRGGTGFTGKAPGGPSRWSTERSAEWVPLRPELVVEVAYDHASGGRFRHGTRFLRFRPDKAPAQCTLSQMKVPVE